MAWYLARVVRPRLDASAQVLEIGAGSVAIGSFLRPEVLGPARYTAVDIRRLNRHARIPPPHRFVLTDVTAIGFADASFDAIVCNNVLPYVGEDRAALAELGRCLKRNGIAMVNTAWRPGATRSVDEVRRVRPDLEDSHFVDHGTRWVYGEDLFERFSAAGLILRADHPFRDCGAEFLRRNGLQAGAEIIAAFRDQAGAARFPFDSSQRS